MNTSKDYLLAPAYPVQTAVFTVDVEDYFMSPECIRFEDWPKYESAIHTGMQRCLKLLEDHQANATFFFVGWLAKRYPEIVRWAADRGHEIATHTFTHNYISEMNAVEFEDTIKRSLDAIHQVTGTESIIGHRAPAFSLDRKKDWQFEILQRNGIQYDSSINPYQTYLFGDRTAPRFPYPIGDIMEIPPATIALLGKRFPVGGGGTLRILPDWYLRFARNRFQREGYVPVVHMHPWEFVPEHPRIDLPGKLHWIHYTGLHSVGRKMRSLLQANRIISLKTYYEDLKSANRDKFDSQPKTYA